MFVGVFSKNKYAYDNDKEMSLCVSNGPFFSFSFSSYFLSERYRYVKDDSSFLLDSSKGISVFSKLQYHTPTSFPPIHHVC